MEVLFVGMDGKKAQRLKDASVFYAELLMDKRIVNNLDLEIKVLDDYEFLGHCLPEDDAKKPRYFTITLQKDNKEMLRTLAHEMVHLKQYATGELSIDDDGIYLYGEEWKPKGKQHKYFDSPWELEAYGRDFGLYYRWTKHEESLKDDF